MAWYRQPLFWVGFAAAAAVVGTVAFRRRHRLNGLSGSGILPPDLLARRLASKSIPRPRPLLPSPEVVVEAPEEVTDWRHLSRRVKHHMPFMKKAKRPPLPSKPLPPASSAVPKADPVLGPHESVEDVVVAARVAAVAEALQHLSEPDQVVANIAALHPDVREKMWRQYLKQRQLAWEKAKAAVQEETVRAAVSASVRQAKTAEMREALRAAEEQQMAITRRRLIGEAVQKRLREEDRP